MKLYLKLNIELQEFLPGYYFYDKKYGYVKYTIKAKPDNYVLLDEQKLIIEESGGVLLSKQVRHLLNNPEYHDDLISTYSLDES